MNSPRPKNIPASVHQRLVNMARSRRNDVNLLLTRFTLERFLYRLSRSPYAESFVLKGAMLFFVWTGANARPTRDVDLLAKVEADPAIVRRIFEEICQTQVENDGLEFRAQLIDIETIQALRQFGGFRVTVPALLGRIRLRTQIDLGFGDAVTPAPKRLSYPTLLDFPAPELAAYPMETVIAEKLEAILKLGTLNTRIKDYYDLLVLARTFAFNGQELASALTATCHARGTDIPQGIPDGLTDAFANDTAARNRWTAYLKRNDLPQDPEWPQAVVAIREFVMAPLHGTVRGFRASWPPGGPWQEERRAGQDARPRRAPAARSR